MRRLPSGNWQARYRDRIGEGHASVFPTKAEAGRWLSAMEADLARGIWFDSRLGEKRFGEWAAEWLETTVHLRPKTRATYESLLRTHVEPRFGASSIGSITPMDVRRFVAEVTANGAAAGTVRNAYRVLRLVLGSAVHAGLLRTNPAEGIRLPRSERGEMVFLDATEVRALSDAIGQPYDLFVTMAAYTGMRAGELAGLRVGRIDLERRVIDVVETIGEANGRLVNGPTKSHERRTVPLPAFLAEQLGDRLSAGPAAPNSLVFTSPDGGPLRHGNFYARHFRPAIRAASLPAQTRFHDLLTRARRCSSNKARTRRRSQRCSDTRPSR